jgi:hypothetical protein
VTLDALQTPEGRTQAGRTLMWICLGAFLLTGMTWGWHRWFFAAMFWFGAVFVPLRVLIEVYAPRGRRVAVAYRKSLPAVTARNLPLVARALLDRDVLMPRIVTPPQAAKVPEAVASIGRRALADPRGAGTIRDGAVRLAAVVDGGMVEMTLPDWTVADGQNIQARWAGIRALSTIAAASRVLVALYEETTRAPFHGPGVDGQRLRAYLDDALAYLDEAAVEPDLRPFRGTPLGLWTPHATSLRHAWSEFLEAPSPAPSRLDVVLANALVPLDDVSQGSVGPSPAR